MDFTPSRGHHKGLPRFGYEAIVEVWTETGPDQHPAARLAIQGSHWSSDGAYAAARFEAKCALSKLGLTEAQIAALGYIEVTINAWWALNPRHVRNPDQTPVAATRHPGSDDDRAQLIKQQRYVPDDWDESTRLYGAKP